MKEWGIIIAATLAVAYSVHSIYEVGGVLGTRLDELHEKVDTLQGKVEEIEDNFETERINKNHVNPIDL